MATGVTSGAVADLLQAAPQLTPDQVKALVMVNADRSYFPVSSSVTDEGVVYNANYDVFTIGAGYLDIAKTVSAALSKGQSVPSGTAMSPVAVYDASDRRYDSRHQIPVRSGPLRGSGLPPAFMAAAPSCLRQQQQRAVGFNRPLG